MKKKTQFLLNLVLTLVFAALIIFQGPNLNPLYPDGAFSWCFIISCYVVLSFFVTLGSLRITSNEFYRPQITLDKSIRGYKTGFALSAILWVLYFTATALSVPLFNYKTYRDQLGTPVVSEFTDAVQPLTLNQLPVVDKSLVKKLADKKMGENPGLGSQVVLGTPMIQKVNDELVWVVPLKHSGFLKWLKNMDGSTGHAVVPANDVSDATLVTNHKVKCQVNAYILDDLNRHVRLLGDGFFKGLTDYSFELDDNGVPYWVISTYKDRWLSNLLEATGVLTVNATTGETAHYIIDSLPEQVDRVQPERFVMEQIQNQGMYVHGIFNFSNQDKFRPSQGNIVIYNGSRCYLFTSLTSMGSDESAVGLILVDMVARESNIYQMSGATKMAAQSSTEGKVQQYGYRASFPMIINMDGQPIYFMTLKDNAGLTKQYAFVSVSDCTNVGTGETIDSALRNFCQAQDTANSNISTGQATSVIKGIVLRITSETIGDTITYKVVLEERKDHIFTVSYELSNELALTQPGDRVSMDYMEDSSGVYAVFSFDNLEFKQSGAEPTS